jgi:hypothetical protein
LLGLAPTELGITGVGFDGGGSYPYLLNFVFQGHVLCLSVAVVMGMAKWALRSPTAILIWTVPEASKVSRFK